MMGTTSSHDDFLPQDSAEDDSSLETNIGQPVSQSELEDLLYGGDRSTEERLALLRSLRIEMLAREESDFGDDDPGSIIAEIDDRIAELEGAEDQTGSDSRLDADPLAHRETLSPDSDELEELEDEDEASLAGDENDLGWDEDEDEPTSQPEEDEP